MMLTKNNTFRRFARKQVRIVLRSLAYLEANELLRLIGHADPVIFCYHSIGLLHSFEKLCNEEISTTLFETQIAEIEQSMQIVTLQDLLRKIQTGEDMERLAVITFDDAWKSTFRNGLPFLAKKNIPSTVFINPAFVDNKQWPSHLSVAWLYDQGYGETLCEVLCDIFHMDYNLQSICDFQRLLNWVIHQPAEDKRMEKALVEVMETISVNPTELAKEYSLFCETTDLLHTDYFCSYGNHGFEHINYGVSSMAARFLDILKAKDWFEQNKIETVDTFALPFGQASHLGEGTADLCTDFGYSTVLMLTGQPCLTNYRGKSTIIDRLLIHPEWDKKDIYLACRGVKVIWDKK